MMRWLILLAAFLTAVTMLFGLVTSGAWFTDSQMVGGVIITTGALDLEVSGGPLSANNLAPGSGYTALGSFCSQNAGDLPLKYRGLFESPELLSGSLLDYLTLQVEWNPGGGWDLLAEIPGRAIAPGGDLESYFQFPGQDPGLVNPPIAEGALDPGQEHCYRLAVKLDESTPNEMQGRSVPFVLHIDATQTNNPGWD